jgi:hypothetical protein
MAAVPHWLDTNALLRLAKRDDPEHALIKAAIDRLIDEGADLCYTPQNVVEFWNVFPFPLLLISSFSPSPISRVPASGSGTNLQFALICIFQFSICYSHSEQILRPSTHKGERKKREEQPCAAHSL